MLLSNRGDVDDERKGFISKLTVVTYMSLVATSDIYVTSGSYIYVTSEPLVTYMSPVATSDIYVTSDICVTSEIYAHTQARARGCAGGAGTWAHIYTSSAISSIHASFGA